MDATIGCQQREAETGERNDTETHVEVEGVTSNEWGFLKVTPLSLLARFKVFLGVNSH